MKLQCENCGFIDDEEEFNEAQDLPQRMEPGSIYTDKECPKAQCWALAYPYEEQAP